ncbi:putative ATP-grasp enzyme [Aeromonas phage LAh_9]|uniref:Putative ATP-grasp enzyme n=1 Tax=Aeromonas phage LAh_9 TaxID=2591033 RepID=A0A514A0S5_9CAUD|nr:ribosomal protein S6 glutaminyl transferase [Aeromonas phage LAh_9]QDH46878.1 putative ATP-grasp enzyme [Aeromonas phage LAh_9]
MLIRGYTMSTIRIYPYGPSESARTLKEGLSETFPNTAVLRREGSRYRPREGHFLINYGSSEVNMDMRGLNVFNRPEHIRNASNKIRAFEAFAAAGIPTVDWTTDRNMAEGWMNDNQVIYARTRLQGHSGEGIVVCSRQNVEGMGNTFPVGNNLVNAPLYTKGVTGNRNEVRVHVAFGRVILEQKKKRVEGYRDLPNYSNVVRNHSTGWIYATEDLNIPQEVRDTAVRAVAALNLDFGAVDIVYKGRTRFEVYVLEVNTAPGLSGESSRAAYVRAFTDRINGVEPAETPEPAVVANQEPVVAQEANHVQEVQPTVVEEVQVAPAAVQRSASQPRTAERPQRPNAQEARPALIEGHFYVVHHTPSETRMVVVYQNSEMWPCGVEMGIPPTECRIIREINIED